MNRILVIDDAEDVQMLVRNSLHSLDVEVDSAYTVKEAIEMAGKTVYQLVVIDIALPDGNGLDLFLQIKGMNGYATVPTIFLTSNEDVSTVVSAFSLGADDYIVKPFRLLELRARIERRLQQTAPKKEATKEGELLAGKLVLNSYSQRVKIDGQNEPISLSPREFKILYLLARNPDRVFSRKTILDQIWGNHMDVTNRTVDAHVCYLRKKLDSFSPYIESVPGEGYRFNPNA